MDLRKVLAMQNFMDTYGIVSEGAKDASNSGIFGAIEYQLKFSIPEKWDSTITLNGAPVTDVVLWIQFKLRLRDVLFDGWMSSNNLTSQELEECWNAVKLLCRTRAGECWTPSDRDDAISKTTEKIEQIADVVKREQEYKEL